MVRISAWQWFSRLEIRLKVFYWSTIPQKLFIIIISSSSAGENCSFEHISLNYLKQREQGWKKTFPKFLCLCDLRITYSLKSFNSEIQGTIQKVTKRVPYSSMLWQYTSNYTFIKYAYIYFQFERQDLMEHFTGIKYCRRA